MAAIKNFLIYFYFYDLINAKLSRVSYSLITFKYQLYFPLSINPLCRWITCRMPTQTVRLRLRLGQKDRCMQDKMQCLQKLCSIQNFAINEQNRQAKRHFRLMLKLYPPYPSPTSLRDDGQSNRDGRLPFSFKLLVNVYSYRLNVYRIK